MAKRIYWQTVLKRAAAIGIPTGIAGFALLFIYLSSLGVIEITGYSGDTICAGTIEDPCYAYINFTANEDIFIYPTDYDPWGRDTPFETDKGLKSWKIYRSWGKGWREIKLNETCKYTWCGAPPNSPDNKYSFAFREGRNYQIRIVAYKNNPTEDIKWGFTDKLDPIWYGTDEGDIGYNILNDTVVIWNTQNAYYFNKSSGIQFTNHYEDYWSKNIFCIGYYNGDSWNKIKCADELSNFNRNIQTDNLTYVNATLWKDFAYSDYLFRLGIRYHLKADDKSLSVTIYGKNLGEDIPVDLGFAWKVTDLDVPSTETVDKIFINNTIYELDETYDLTFKDMKEYVNTSFPTNQTTSNGTMIYNYSMIEVPIPFYKIYDRNKEGLLGQENFLRIDWDENLNYAVKMYGDGNQENFYTALLINTGNFSQGIEKSTTFYWIDALTDDITSYWKMDEQDITGSGTIYDELYINNGTNDGASNVTGKINTAYDFDDSSDEISFSSAILPTGTNDSFAISCWIKPTLLSTVASNSIVSQYASVTGRMIFHVNIAGKLTLFLNGGATVTGSMTISNGNWYHVVVSRDVNNVSLYVNGSFDTSGTNGAPIYNGNTQFANHPIDDNSDFNGIMDECGIWGRALTSAEVSDLYADYAGNQYPFGDTIPPTYSNAGHNTTDAGQLAKFYILYDDETALHPNGQYVFSTNNTGTWTNESVVNFTTTPEWVNITKVLNSTVGTIVGYRWYANDSAGNANHTGIYTLIIVDTIGPIINVTYPANTTYSTNVSNLNYTYIEPNPDSCWYSKDGGATNSSAVAIGINFTDVVSVGGNNTWTVFCNDTSSNVGSGSITFSLNVLWYNSGYPFSNKSFRISEFIEVNGTNFTLGGENYRFLGADSYYLADYATNHTYDDDGNEINNSRQYVLEILNEAQYLNINVIRTWAGMQGSDDSHWVINESGGHYNLFEVGEPGNYSEEMFVALDWVIYEASQRDVRLQLVLVNNWNDYGGMRWYAQKSPTTDKTHENVSDYDDNNYWVFHDQFYDDENCRQYFRNYINHTLNRNNTYSGILYKDDPAIFAWLLANEPRAKSDGEGRSLIRDWTINMTAYIKSIDSNHLVGLGIEGWGYVETWGEGTDMIADHNNTGVDFATYALHPDQWQYFAERSEHDGGGWVTEGTGTNAFVDWWTNDTGLSYNNRWESPGYVPAYIPALDRYAYDNWVAQNVKWANDLGMPILLQEIGYLTNHSKVIKDRFFEQTIHNFYNEGGDGLLFWTLNHDEYYYSTDIDGIMDDGYAFYLSDDPFLKNKSESIIDAINFTKHDDEGESWIRELNPYKYDFVLNIGFASDTEMDNCTLYLNVSNGTWSGYYADQANSTPLTYNDDYTFTKQFDSDDEEFYWYTQCFGDSEYINSTEAYALIKSDTPVVSLVSPGNDTFQDTTIEFVYNVTNGIGISFCELYVDGILNKTDYTVTRDINQTFLVDLPDAIYNWSITCTDIDSNEGSSITRIFTITTFNVFFNGISGNNTAELGELNLIANSTANITICVDIDHPAFGKNYSCGYGVNINFTTDYFRDTLFSDDAESKTFNYTTLDIANLTFNAHQYDEMDAMSVNISGINDPFDVLIFLANSTPDITNQTQFEPLIDRFFDGQLVGDNIYVSQFWNNEEQVNLTFNIAGEQVVYFLLDDIMSTTSTYSFLLNVTGWLFGYDYKGGDSTTRFTNYSDIDTTQTTTHLDLSGAIMAKNSSKIYSNYDDYDSSINGTLWGTYISNPATSENTETSSYIQSNVALGYQEGSFSNHKAYVYANHTYFNLYSSDEIRFRVVSKYDGGELDDSVDGKSKVYLGNTVIWTSSYLECAHADGNEESDGDLDFILTKVDNTHWLIEISGVETSISGDYSPCGDDSARGTWNWTNGTYEIYCVYGGYGPWSGSLNNSFLTTVDYNHPLTVASMSIGSKGNLAHLVNLYTRLYPINRSLYNRESGTVISQSIYDSSADIDKATIWAFGAEGSAGETLYGYLSADNGLNWENVTAATEYTFNNVGRNLRFKLEINSTGGYFTDPMRIYQVNVSVPQDSPSNISFDFGDDGTADYTISGKINETNGSIEVDISNVSLSSAFVTSNKWTNVITHDHIYKIPLSISTDSRGVLQVDTINITYNPNPISLNTEYISDVLENTTNFTTFRIPIGAFNLTADSVNITVNDIRRDYAGGNQTIQFVVHDSDYNLNKTANIIYYYSGWDYDFVPENIEWIEFIPTGPASKNVTPFGQTSTVPILNLTNYGYGGLDVNLSVTLSSTFHCVNLTLNTVNNKLSGYLLSTDWSEFSSGVPYLTNTSIFLWADYDCTSRSNWTLFNPNLIFRQCANSTLCSVDTS